MDDAKTSTTVYVMTSKGVHRLLLYYRPTVTLNWISGEIGWMDGWYWALANIR